MTTVDELKDRYPRLFTREDRPNMSPHALGARNLRILLDEAFPGREFSIKTRAYANGSSINVHWKAWDLDEEERKKMSQEIQAMANLFCHGDFDGMTGSYHYAGGTRRLFCDMFGSAKFCFTGPRRLDGLEEARLRAQELDQTLAKPAARTRSPRM